MKALEVTPLQQPNDVTCVHTCLAMLFDVTVDELMERFGYHGLSFDEKATVLVENKVFPVITTTERHPLREEGVYFVGTGSLNHPGKMHCVLVKVKDAKYHVYDPNQGREGKQAYVAEDIVSGKLYLADVTFCDLRILRKMDRPTPV